jgi:hypothetical protein
LRVNYETADEVEVSIYSMLLRQLHTRQGKRRVRTSANTCQPRQLTERISIWFLSKLSSVSVERRNTICALTMVWMLVLDVGGFSIDDLEGVTERRALPGPVGPMVPFCRVQSRRTRRKETDVRLQREVAGGFKLSSSDSHVTFPFSAYLLSNIEHPSFTSCVLVIQGGEITTSSESNRVNRTFRKLKKSTLPRTQRNRHEQ